MSCYTQTSLRVKATLASINGGTAWDVYVAMRAVEIEPPSVKTIERHLLSLRSLGIVTCAAVLIDDRPKKIYKVRTCPTQDTKCPLACLQSQQRESLSNP